MKHLPVKVCGTPVPKSAFIPIVNVNDAFYDIKCPTVRSGLSTAYYFSVCTESERAIYSLVIPSVLCKGSDDDSAATPLVISVAVPKGCHLTEVDSGRTVSPAQPLMGIYNAFVEGFVCVKADGRCQYAFTNVDTTAIEQVASKYVITPGDSGKWYPMKPQGKAGAVCVGEDDIAEALMDMQRPEFAEYREIVLTDDPSLLADCQKVTFAQAGDSDVFTSGTPAKADKECPRYEAPANAQRLYLATDMKRTYHGPQYFEVYVRGRKVDVERDFTIKVASYDVADLQIKYRGDDYEVVGCRNVSPELRLIMKPVIKEVAVPVEEPYETEQTQTRPAWVMLSIGILLGVLIGFGIAMLCVLLKGGSDAPAAVKAPADTVKTAPVPTDTAKVAAPEVTDTVPEAQEETAAPQPKTHAKTRKPRTAASTGAPVSAPVSSGAGRPSDIDVLAPVSGPAPTPKPSLDPTAERPLPQQSR